MLLVLLYLPMHRITSALGCRAHLLVWQEEGAFCAEHLAVFHLPPPPNYFALFMSVTGTCLLRDMGAHGCLVRFCQPSVQSPSWSWLSIVEAPGCVIQTNLHIITYLLKHYYYYYCISANQDFHIYLSSSKYPLINSC